ncbi:hypothetical protein NGRA_1292 [Nosema granulosis]|uniref:Uncharacterized protein n=1 Tax=Nosema granulosis TaxID=83296 RepID=A0A9P6GZQ6_9MICR|nr:hypothetical protein NGRA_1292 [Nosema granulosis]
MKKRALSSDESNRNVVLNVLKENLSIKVPLNLKKLNDYVHKERKTNNFTVTNNYDIPVELQETVGGKQFLMYDSALKDADRVVIFLTVENLKHVCTTKIMYF